MRQERASEPGATTLNRHTYLRLTLTYLWDNAVLLVLGSLILSVVCGPAYLLFTAGLYIPAVVVGVVTVAPGWSALLALEAALVQDAKANVLTLLKAFPRYWLRSVVFGLAIGFPIVTARYTFPLFGLDDVPGFVWLSVFAEISLGALMLALGMYAFPLLVLYDSTVRDAVRNAAILASRYISNTLGLVGMAILFAMGVGYLSSGLLFFLPTIWGIFIVNNCRVVVTEALAEADEETAGDPP